MPMSASTPEASSRGQGHHRVHEAVGLVLNGADGGRSGLRHELAVGRHPGLRPGEGRHNGQIQVPAKGCTPSTRWSESSSTSKKMRPSGGVAGSHRHAESPRSPIRGSCSVRHALSPTPDLQAGPGRTGAARAGGRSRPATARRSQGYAGRSRGRRGRCSPRHNSLPGQERTDRFGGPVRVDGIVGGPLAAGRQSGTSAVAGSVEDGEAPVDELGGLALDVGVFVRQWEVGPSRRRRGPSRSVRASCPTTVLRATPTRRVLDPRCSGLRTTPSREQPEVHAPRSSGVCG